MPTTDRKKNAEVHGNDGEFEILIGHEYGKVARKYIKEARDEILVSVFLWNFYYGDPACEASKFNQEIINAVKRGVKVKGLVSTTAKVKKMIEAGCQIKESCFANKLHNKVMIIDQKIVILGSHNFTKNALGRNYEVSMMFEIEGKENRLYRFIKTMVEQNG